MNSREIKFRVWDNIKKCFLLPYPTINDYQHCPIQEEIPSFLICGNGELAFGNNGLSYTSLAKEENKKRYVIQQYTGIKDKNGKEIYDGDVLKIYWETDPQINYPEYTPPEIIIRHAKVIWNNQGMFATEYLDWFRTNSGKDDGKPVGGGFIISGQSEVVGNIFENTGLLNL